MSAAIALIQTVKANNILPEDFAEVLTKCRRAGVLIKDEENPMDNNLADIIADYPVLFETYLNEGFGTAHITRILNHIFRMKNAPALKMFLNAPHIATAISRRPQFWANRFGSIRTSSECWAIILNHPEFKITADDLHTDSWQMTDESIIQILRHPRHYHLLYLMDDCVKWQEDLQRRLYGTITSVLGPAQFQHEQALRLHVIIQQERYYRAQRAIRFVFWTSVLKIRVREFVERYWAPGGPKSLALEKDFNKNLAATT